MSASVAGENPNVSGVAGRYATALFELALESGAIDTVRADLAKFQALLVESPDLSRLVRSPVFTADVQEKALAAVLQSRRDRRDRGEFPAGRRRQPAAVRGRRHHQGL